MDTVTEIALEFMKFELTKTQFEVSQTKSGREGVDFIIKSIDDKSYNLFFKTFDADTERSIKISKQDLGELNDDLLIGLVLLVENEARVLYLIPSKDLLQSNSNIFINNVVSLIPSLSNWEIKIFSKGLDELEIYTISNQIEKLR
ncbi:hypothetical protein FG167_14215 [Lacinutrix sp. WUR7]|uniref:hypothetical protein n=1 Tax=Lacinutrix sp. WUR7 TaxID=2653681 RepID=UPI00193C88B8|nr:hypothetical protein [Lacinutrix sp. WUR7]QRM90341.1 hypothetical protein FG167_14215 [Lacinutrix sp. WUR7]